MGSNSTESKKTKKMSKLREKFDMYDMIIANLIAGKSIIEPTQRLSNSQLAIGFSNIASENMMMKYFIVSAFPDYLHEAFVDQVRNRCLRPGVRINFYFYGSPHTINWDSAEMKNRMYIWRKYSEESAGPVDVFSYRDKRGDVQTRNRIIQSTKYLNQAELDYKRSLLKVSFVIAVSANRDDNSILNMIETIRLMKELCSSSDIRLRELRINMIDWVRAISPFCMRCAKQMEPKLCRKVLTDDILANMNGYKQGRVGVKGIPLGIDILSSGPVMRVFKEDPDGPDNWLISAGTGGGKSMFVKSLITYLLADNFTVVVMDYEGDEYNYLANYVKAGNPKDVKIVSMGKSNTVYFDPCEIPRLTGDPKVDNDLKENSVNFIVALFKTMVHGMDGDFTRVESKVMSTAIQKMYDTAGVTEDKETWSRSKGLRLAYVYEEIKRMVESKELVDSDDDNSKHKAAMRILDATSIHFEPGEIYYNYWRNPMSADELYDAKFIIFSFGMKGADNSSVDNILLGLKQLSVAYVNILISNYCKYVKHGFNVKIWEEFQRWGELKSSADIIVNIITGGRKRGDANFIITNNLSAMLDDENKLCTTIMNNLQNFAIGTTPDKRVRRKFCENRDLMDCLPALDKIAKANPVDDGKRKKTSVHNRYKYAFCVVMDNGKKVIVKSMLPKSILDSTLLRSGVIASPVEEL